MLSDEVMETIRQSLGLDEDDTSRDEEIRNYDLRTTLDKYLKWEGIQGYTDIIVSITRVKEMQGNERI